MTNIWRKEKIHEKTGLFIRALWGIWVKQPQEAFIVSFKLFHLKTCNPDVAALPATLHVIFMSSLSMLWKQCILLRGHMLRTDIKISRFPRGFTGSPSRARWYVRVKKIKVKLIFNLYLERANSAWKHLKSCFIYFVARITVLTRWLPFWKCHVHVHTYLLAAAEGQIHAIHIRGNMYIQRARSVPICFGSSEISESGRSQGNVQTAVGVTLVLQTQQT